MDDKTKQITDAINALWRQRIADYAAALRKAWEAFDAATEAIDDCGMDAEEFAPVFQMLEDLRRMGVRFDPSFIARMRELRADAERLDVDSDDDATDERCADDGFGTHLEHHAMTPECAAAYGEE